MTDNPHGVLISFSGGRTSGYLLWRILQANRGKLPPNHIVGFANTGKEFPETLEFVHEIETKWGVPIHWVEFTGIEYDRVVDKERQMSAFYKTVSRETASRKGEPFDLLTTLKSYLPNSAQRFCTQWLKVLVLKALMRDLGYPDPTTLVGIRADEPKRIAKIKARVDAGEDIGLPLVTGRVLESDVFEFWDSHPFDLQLPKGTSNCDLCFLKGKRIRGNILLRDPKIADWWIAQEDKIDAQFDKTISARQLQAKAIEWLSHPQLPMYDEEEDGVVCFCTD